MSEAEFSDDVRNRIVFDYEVGMYKSLHWLFNCGAVAAYSPVAGMAITEALALHTRVLCEVLLTDAADRKWYAKKDIVFDELLPGFDLPSRDLLRSAYGDKNKDSSPAARLNALLAHATTLRASYHHWGETLSPVWEALDPCLDEIEHELRRREETI